MRVRDHIALSTIGAGLLLPFLGRKALIPWAASILIDSDHVAWYSIRKRTLNPQEAVRYFNTAMPEQGPATRALHLPWTLVGIAALGGNSRMARLTLLGLLFHVALDGYHETRNTAARRSALARDEKVCQGCGERGAHIVAHQWRQPTLLPSYRPECFISLCPQCHEAAHTYGTAKVVPGLLARRDASTDAPTGVSIYGRETFFPAGTVDVLRERHPAPTQRETVANAGRSGSGGGAGDGLPQSGQHRRRLDTPEPSGRAVGAAVRSHLS